MAISKRDIFITIICLILPAGLVLSTGIAGATECDCSFDAASPPFLASGADPNMLLLIDNSASMYDVAYQDATKESWECFDDSFNAAGTYVGYFEKDQWYHYDNTVDPGRFVPVDLPPAAAQNGGTFYTSANLKIEMWGSDATGWNIDLTATGNLLNWAAASKFDIEKDILTGGKYDENDEIWFSEGRGCGGYRFVKEVVVSSGGTNYKLTMGITSDENEATAIEDETTLIEIFKISEEGFSYGACKTAVDEVLFGTGNPQNAVGNCIDPNNDADNPEKQVLIHSTTDCWKFWKGDLNNWPQHTTPLLGECGDVYAAGVDPREILPSNPAFACYGEYNADPAIASGYIGRCWVPSNAAPCPPVDCADIPGRSGNDPYFQCNASDEVEYCPKSNFKQGACNVAWRPYYAPGTCPDDPGAGWIGGYDGTGNIPVELDECMADALGAYCGETQVPEVKDPSDLVINPDDQSVTVGEVYNLPAILISAGAEGQLGEPIARLNGLVKKKAGTPAPEGLLHAYADEIRIGAMAFHDDGSASECDPADFDPYTTYDCDDPDNKDGSYLVQSIGGNTADLISNINDIKADAWTPLAEAMFNAIGYYTQNNAFRIQPDDFTIDGVVQPAPITEYCQANNIVLITDGSSTADLNPGMAAIAGGIAKDPGDTDDPAGCGALYGSTYLDDLAYYARDLDIYANNAYNFAQDPENIATYFVVNGSPRNIGSGECNPEALLTSAAANGSDKPLFTAENPDELYSQLDELFQYTLKRASAGSAASVIAATRSGEGAVYQAIFWPNMDDPTGLPTVTWAGEVHALMVDSLGNLYEDTNQNATLNVGDDPGDDERVIFYYDNWQKKTMGCYDGTVDILEGTCSGTAKDLSEVKYLWSAAEWLAGISDADITSNRSPYLSNEKKRYIFTWNDLDNDGKADGVFPFVASATNWNIYSAIALAAGRGSVFSDFGVADKDELNELINWIRGKDTLADAALRKRQVPTPANFDNNNAAVTWRLGDIIHSTPTAVGRPTESYHLLYQDDTYAKFFLQYEKRRNVIYFGANDGMLHAVNGGFFDANTNAFCKGLDIHGECTNLAGAPDLGAELWAYVPYNLQPHLKCLKDPDYNHKYFMDLKPRIFDVKIFPADADHPEGWGTILVAGMRLGGKEIESDTDDRKFISAYVILDITNPEVPPTLLGELNFDPATSADMGFTTGIPSVVAMKPENNDVSQWYLVFGNGPTTLDGISNIKPRISAFNLNQLAPGGSAAFRIANTLSQNGGSTEIDLSGNGFVSDSIVMDYLVGGTLDTNYRADAVYFGTVEGTWGNFGGKMYRWVLNTDQSPSTPDDWGDIDNQPSLLLDAERPITAAPTVGWDGISYWVYFGTGRFYHKDDKTDAGSNAQDTYYGLKEPIDLDGNFTWDEISNEDVLGFNIGTADLPGTRKLFRADQIEVSLADSAAASEITCADDTENCLPASVDAGGADGKVNTLAELEQYVAGTGFHYNGGTPDGFTGTDGWYLHFPESRERNLGQATLLGGLTTFTTYQPFDDICLPEGKAALYGVYYKTGTAWHASVFKDGTVEGDPPEVVSRIEIGRGLATTPNLHVGRSKGAKAIVQTSTGAIVEIEQPELPLAGSKSGRTNWRND